MYELILGNENGYSWLATIDRTVEPQIPHVAIFTPCKELVPILHFWKM